MRKILYDIDVTTVHEKMRPVVRVTATVRRYYLDDKVGETMKTAWLIPEPATQITRAIPSQELDDARDPKGLLEAETNAVTSEAMRIAMRRGPCEEWPGFVGLDRAMDAYRGKPAPRTYEEAHYWRSRAWHELKAAFSEKRLGVLGHEPVTGKQRCPVCLGPACAKPGSPCPICQVKIDGMKPRTITVQGPPCLNCNSMKGRMPGREECPDCGWDGVTCAYCGENAPVAASSLCATCKSCKDLGDVVKEAFAAARLDRDRPTAKCPECGGAGEVQLFTSVQPCSRGCKKR